MWAMTTYVDIQKTVILGTNATIEGFFWFSIALVKFLIRIQICDLHSQT